MFRDNCCRPAAGEGRAQLSVAFGNHAKITTSGTLLPNAGEGIHHAGLYAGNHAQGVALAAQKLGTKATVVMPCTTPAIKIQAVMRLGGRPYCTAIPSMKPMAMPARWKGTRG